MDRRGFNKAMAAILLAPIVSTAASLAPKPVAPTLPLTVDAEVSNTRRLGAHIEFELTVDHEAFSKQLNQLRECIEAGVLDYGDIRSRLEDGTLVDVRIRNRAA